MVLSSAPQRAAHRAADLLMLCIVKSFSNRVLDIYEITTTSYFYVLVPVNFNSYNFIGGLTLNTQVHFKRTCVQVHLKYTSFLVEKNAFILIVKRVT